LINKIFLIFYLERRKRREEESNIVTKKNILLVDDEPDITFTLKYSLEVHDFKVDAFTDPTIALQNFKVIA
jgi:PleD family two-component response regulator